MGISEGPYSGRPNPHAWMSSNNALIYVENIRKALVKHDPANADAYNKNAAAYSAQIKALDEPLRKRLAAIPENQRWLVSSEGAFSYLTRDYQMQEAYLGRSMPTSRGRPSRCARSSTSCARTRFRWCSPRARSRIAPPSRSRARPARSMAACFTSNSLSAVGGPVPTYLDLLKVTVETIVKGFGK